MEELSFSPSESVWTGVETRLKKGKERKAPLIWIFLTIGIILAGGLYWEFRETPAMSGQGLASHPPHAETTGQGPTGTIKPSHADNHDLGQDATLSGVRAGKINHEASSSARNRTNGNQNNELPMQGDKKNIQKTKSGRTNSSLAKLKTGTRAGANLKDKASYPDHSQNEGELPGAESSQVKPANVDDHSRKISDGNPGVQSVAIPPSATAKDFKADSPLRDSVRPVAASGKKQSNINRSPWKWGFSTAGGISTVYQSLFTRSVAGPVAYYSLAPYSFAPVLFYSPSDVRPGFSFSGGFFVERAVSKNKKLSVSAGLNYHYYSSRIETGNHSSNTILVSPSNTSMLLVNGYYQNGGSQTYANQYHFLELPVNLLYQLLSRRNFMLFGEAGIEVGQLVGSNALHFDYGSGSYYQDNSLLTKTQFNGSVAIMAGFYQHKTQIKIGPAVQYGFTNLVSGSSGDKQHLFFGGIQIKIIPGRRR
jgi:hypothetical protein